MNSFIQKLRSRDVFRTAGLYVGIVWILIEAASIILPTFDAPDWVMQAIVITAVIGFPVTLVLSWVFNITEKGVELHDESTEEIIPYFKDRKLDFIIIGILLVALILSVGMNITNVSEKVSNENVSILIADFDNKTQNPVFKDVLEMALIVGIESAPYISSYRRNEALAVANTIQQDTPNLNADIAQLVAIQEGIGLVILGSIVPKKSEFNITIKAIEPVTGEEVFALSKEAKSTEHVLETIGKLAQDVRKKLGDDSISSESLETYETFTAASLEAAQLYSKAQQLAIEGNNEAAIELFQKVTELDPNFSRAYAGWALSETNLGREEKAAKLWQESLSRMNRISERERLRTLGIYYVSVTKNFEKAKEVFSELVKKYPSDTAGHNNLAVVAFYLLDFDTATSEGKIVLDLYPKNSLFRSNFALYAMYSGKFTEASEMAKSLVEDEPNYGTGYLPLAIGYLATGDFAKARDTYNKMTKATLTEFRESTATLGLADLEMFRGNFSAAREILTPAIKRDIEANKEHHAAVKLIALAQTEFASGNHEAALDFANKALTLSSRDSILVGAARIFLDSNLIEKTEDIANTLSAKLQKHSRAYGLMIKGAIKRKEGNFIEAFDTLGAAVQFADLWLIRLEIGKTYLAAGYYVEALDEFVKCEKNKGQATAVFLDDLPSFRYLSTLPYWTARAQEGLGNIEVAKQTYEQFIDTRPQGSPFAKDAQKRILSFYKNDMLIYSQTDSKIE
ncbi:tetratricopeptide repeat protein [Paraglaciecola aestuariivivens]